MNKKKMKLWEKIFIIANIIVIFTIIGIYGYRTIYYYKKTNGAPADNKLVTALLNINNITFKDDGLYQAENDYYFKGYNVNNYVYYSGRIWRIISIDSNGIKMVTDDNQTSLVWGFDNNYQQSYIYKWLNNTFLPTITESEKNLISGSWCNQKIDINNYSCVESINNYVGLLSTQEYIRSGGKEGYLNNNTYWWTLNTNESPIYVHSEGGINNKSKDGETYYSYGVRPSIILNTSIKYISGNGTKETPYIIDNNTNIEIGKHNVGNYVSYNNYTWRIVDTSESYTKLIMNGYIKSNNNEYVTSNYSNLDNYLKNTFITNFNKDELSICDFYKNTYNYNYLYDYSNKSQVKVESYIGIPIVGELFTTDYDNYWLDSKLDSVNKLVYIQDKNSLFADLTSNKYYIRPMICIRSDLIIKYGNGTIDAPFVVGENNETNN